MLLTFVTVHDIIRVQSNSGLTKSKNGKHFPPGSGQPSTPSGCRLNAPGQLHPILFGRKKRKLRNSLLTNARKCDTIHVQSNDGTNGGQRQRNRQLTTGRNHIARRKSTIQEINRMDGDSHITWRRDPGGRLTAGKEKAKA